MDAVLKALKKNTNCQALYIQNFNEGMRDKQMRHLIQILQQRQIWCINVGETYNVSSNTWRIFTKGLKRTFVTHMYASEHTITNKMKNKMRETVRLNRSKHTQHINPKNLEVIIRCTHCWWNPMNAKKLLPYLREAGHDHLLHDTVAMGLPTEEEMNIARN